MTKIYVKDKPVINSSYVERKLQVDKQFRSEIEINRVQGNSWYIIDCTCE